MDTQELLEQYTNYDKSLNGTVCSENKKGAYIKGGHDFLSDVIKDGMRDTTKVELEWPKARETDIEYSRACEKDLANVVTWYIDRYLPPMPPPLPPN